MHAPSISCHGDLVGPGQPDGVVVYHDTVCIDLTAHASRPAPESIADLDPSGFAS